MIEGRCTPQLRVPSEFCLDYRVTVFFPLIAMPLPIEDELLKSIYQGFLYENPKGIKRNIIIFDQFLH